jgi:hypothetical protein
MHILEKALSIVDGHGRRLEKIRLPLENARTPSKLLESIESWSHMILKTSGGNHYIITPKEVAEDDVLLMASFYPDLVIATNMMMRIIEVIGKGETGEMRRMVEEAVKCPLRKVPKLGCKDKEECIHEKPWLDAWRSQRK